VPTLQAWQYFTAHPELQTLFIVNNDVIVSKGAFSKLHRCLMNAPVGGVMGPMSNSLGLGEGTMYQNLENRVNRHYYGGVKVPQELRDGLPSEFARAACCCLCAVPGV
jgi:hypothetical protein